MDKIKVSVEIDLKTFRKALVLLDQDVPSDEELLSKLSGEELLNLDPIGKEQSEELKLALAMFYIGQKFS